LSFAGFSAVHEKGKRKKKGERKTTTVGESNPGSKTMRKATRAIGGRVKREGQMAWRGG